MAHEAHKRPIHATRWRNFRALLDSHKLSITAVADKLGKTQGQVSRFGGDPPGKVIGDQIAGEIEDAFGLPPGSLDHMNGEETVNNRSYESGTASQFRNLDDGILAQAEDWVAFEERARGARFRYPPVRRLRRSIELVQVLLADGGTLTPTHAAAIIEASKDTLGERSDSEQDRGAG